MRQVSGPHLIVVPKSTLPNWLKELHKWTPHLRCFGILGTKEEREATKKERLVAGTFDVCVTTYEVACIEKSALRKFSWRYIVIDEAHRIKNENSQLSVTLRTFDSQCRLLITGTPLQNNLHELWALLNFLLPDIFGSSDDWESWFGMEHKKKPTGRKRGRPRKEKPSPLLVAAEKKEAESAMDVEGEKEVEEKKDGQEEDKDGEAEEDLSESEVIGEEEVEEEKKDEKQAEEKQPDAEQSQSKDQEVIERLHKVLRPFLLRRVKSDVAKDLPPKTEVKLYVKMSPLQREWYKKILTKDVDAINTATGPKTRLANILMQLRKTCNHPYIFPAAEPGPPYVEGEHLITACGKLVVLDKLLTRLKARDSRVLVFSQMTRMLDVLEDYMNFRGHTYARIDGDTDHMTREDLIDAYNAPDSPLFAFLLSTRAGGLGINLATADVVILYDSDWNPQVDLQAQDRAHRIGQKKEVTVYRLVTENSVEEKIVERAEAKLRLDALVIQQGRLIEQHKSLNKTEMLSMIRYGADDIFNVGDKDAVELTDEDIDAIIERGKKKTADLAAKFESKEAQDKLLSWSMEPDAQTSVYDWEGENYKAKKISVKHFIDVGRRERVRTQYNETAYYRSVLSGGSQKERKKRTPRPPKQPVIHPWQFMPKRLTELFEKETKAWLARRGNGGEGEGALPPELTEAEEAEKDQLLQKGFRDWTRKDFDLFLRASKKYGRDKLVDIAAMIEGKTLDEVSKYAKAFWKNVHRLPNGQKYEAMVEKGERKIVQHEATLRALKARIETCKPAQPWHALSIHPIGAAASKHQYTPEADVFLLCMTYRVGYGKWDEIKAAIGRHWQFRMDWYLQSRTVSEIERRVDALLKALEKEVSDKGVDVDFHIRNRPDGPVERPQPDMMEVDEQLVASSRSI